MLEIRYSSEIFSPYAALKKWKEKKKKEGKRIGKRASTVSCTFEGLDGLKNEHFMLCNFI